MVVCRAAAGVTVQGVFRRLRRRPSGSAVLPGSLLGGAAVAPPSCGLGADKKGAGRKASPPSAAAQKERPDSPAVVRRVRRMGEEVERRRAATGT